jgi:hypothetical protein
VPPFINKKERKSTQQQQIRFRLHKHTLSRFFFFFFSLSFRTKYLFSLLRKHNHREEEVQEATKKSIIMNRKKAPGTSFSPTETNKYSTEIRLSPSLCLFPPPHAHKREEKKTRSTTRGQEKEEKSE